MPKFSAQHYNAIAKDIREEFPPPRTEYPEIVVYRKADNVYRAALCNLAIRLARRFKADNPIFDPLIFLDQCSPDTDLYPLSELWKEVK